MNMKKSILYIAAAALGLICASSCVDLDMNPLSSASNENWYKNADQITMALNDQYRKVFYAIECEYWTDRRTDDWAQRDYTYELVNGSWTSATKYSESFWENTYKAISRSIRVIESIEKLGNPESLASLKAEAHFFRAYFYARLATLWGDAPFYTRSITTEEAYTMGRTDKKVIMEQVYKDFDLAIEGLPVDNSNGGVVRVNKATALSCKARYALYWGDYAECEKLCKEVMDMKKYSLYPDYDELFTVKTLTCENIWSLPVSYALDPEGTQAIKSFVLRTAGGNATAQPSWDLLAAYECTDGKLIDESPLFDPKDPYKNRDPRCAATFVVPGTMIYGVLYDPSPKAINVYDEVSGQDIKNKDCKTNDVYAAYNGCCLRKGAQPEWRDGQYSENPQIMVRYADILLMYAEAKIEQNKIDQSVLDAINSIRARAYGVAVDEVASYPAITTTDQAELRQVVRRERRVEFAWEGRRFFDLRRWGLLEKAYSHHYYGLPNQKELAKYFDAGNWFWPRTPDIDEDGFADFSEWTEIVKYGHHQYDPKVELLAIPNADMLINDNLEQNPGY